jgi:TusA-related sulfurtransferase
MSRRSIKALKPKADYILDFSQTITSYALLKMTQVMRDMNRDEVLEIITRDADARTDVFKLIPAASCEVVDMEFNKDADFCRIRVKRI